jgi:hypothetical protein
VEASLMRASRARIATALLTFLLPRQDVEAIVGDLEEENGSISQSSSASSWWFWRQVVRSIPPLFWLPIQRGGWRSTFGVAVAACAIQVVIEVTTGVAVHELSPPSAQWPALVALLVTLGSLALVGYASARIRAGAATALASMAGAAILARLVLTAFAGGGVAVEAVAALIVAPAMVVMGGSLSFRARQR